MISALTPGVQHDFAGLYAKCNEVEQQTAMATMQPVEVKMYQVVIDQEAERQPAMANTGSGGPPPPVCNATTHGYELLATIDGTDTKFSCNLANLLFSWVGAAALGGYLGRNVQAFVSAVISGAAGTYVLTLTEDADVGTDLVVQPGQNFIISGDARSRWGSGGFTVGEMGSLSLQTLSFASNIEVLAGNLVIRNTEFHTPSHLMLHGGVTLVDDCTWEGNDKDTAHPEVDAGILIHGQDCVSGRTPRCKVVNIVDSNSTFESNHYGSAAIYFGCETPDSLVRIESCHFYNNKADDGGGATNMVGQASLSVVGTTFLGNTVIALNPDDESGAIRFGSSGFMHISSSMFDGNAVSVSGNLYPDGCVLGCNPHAVDNAIFLRYGSKVTYTNADMTNFQPLGFGDDHLCCSTCSGPCQHERRWVVGGGSCRASPCPYEYGVDGAGNGACCARSFDDDGLAGAGNEASCYMGAGRWLPCDFTC